MKWMLLVLLSFATLWSEAVPSFGKFGLDQAGQDLKVHPGDDFFRFANGTWIDNTPIPSDKSSYSPWLANTDLIEKRLHEIMEQDGGKIGTFYKSFMDEARIEQLGIKALAADLKVLRSVSSHENLAAFIGSYPFRFHRPLFALDIDVDVKNPDQYAVYISQSGLGLPDRDYYLSPQFAQIKSKYEVYLATLLNLIQWQDADLMAKKVVSFETEIAEASWPRVEMRDPLKTYNPMTMEELQAFAPGLLWKTYLMGASLSEQRVVVREKSAIEKIAKVFNKTPVDVLQAWVAVTTVDQAAPYLSKPYQDAFFDMRKRTLSGQEVWEPRWTRGVRTVSQPAHLGWAVGKIYVAKYFPPAVKAQMEELVANLKQAFHDRIQNVTWLSPQTKDAALTKLKAFHVEVGYPEKWRDYSMIEILPDDLTGNVLRSQGANWLFFVFRLHTPVDRLDWQMTPQTNNAYFEPPLNKIVFPAGILQPPIFDPHADPAINYGAIGAVIGHEMTHGFDDEGRKYDAKGALRDWWTAEDATNFEARAQVLSRQYSTFEPLPGFFVNGQLTLGENIADLGGLILALDAYHESLKGKPAPVIDGTTGVQRVFFGWAQAWRGKIRDDALRLQVVSDPHSPRVYRCNGIIRNIDCWYEAFNIQPDHELYLPPEERVRIW